MVAPAARAKMAASKYWLRARARTNNSKDPKIIVSEGSLCNISKNIRSPRKRDINALVAAAGTAAAPALRKSARLCNQHAELQGLRTPVKRTHRSALVSVKSLLPPEDDSGGIRVRRKSARLFEKQAASLLRPAPVQPLQNVNPKAKKKHICWLIKDTNRGIKSDRKSRDGGRPRQKQQHYRPSTTKKRAAAVECHDMSPPVLQRLTELGEEDLLQNILERLPFPILVQAARVCRSWARLCESGFKEECRRKGWSLPRMPRGVNPVFPWRSLYYRHACRACEKVGEFYVRKTLDGSFQFLLCRSCTRRPDVQDRLVPYTIDLYGVTGKLLVNNIMSRFAI